MSVLSLLLLPKGRTAPQFALPDLKGEMKDLSALLENRRALVVDFFFLACKPCHESLVNLNQLFHRHGQDGLGVVAISRGDSPEALRAFTDVSGFVFPTLAAADDDPVFRSYRVLAYPTTYVVDSQGRIVYRRAGHDTVSLGAAVARLGFSL